MPLTKCAVFYWSSSGVLALKILADDDSHYTKMSAPKGQTMFLADLVQNPKQMGCPYDHTCHILIGKDRGLPALTDDDQRAAQIDATGNVVAVLVADPQNVQPADLGGPKDHSLVKAHPAAMEGDTYSAGVFSRRYVIADKLTGLVTGSTVAPLDQPIVTAAGSFATPSVTAQIGDVVPVPIKAVVTPTL